MDSGTGMEKHDILFLCCFFRSFSRLHTVRQVLSKGWEISGLKLRVLGFFLYLFNICNIYISIILKIV